MLKLREKTGITLVALVVTIIVLLILAGITIATLTGENGLLTKTSAAKEKHNQSEAIENMQMKIQEAVMDLYSSGKEITIDNLKEIIEDKVDDIDENDGNLLITIGDYVFEINENLKMGAVIDTKTNIRKDLETGEESLNEPHTITYNGNGGEGTVESQSVVPGVKVKLRENEFTKQYYTFVGWDTQQDGKGTRYLQGAQIKINEDITLYAQWERDTVTLSFDNNGGTGSIDDIKLESGKESAISTNTSITREGYKFNGWNTVSDGTGDTVADGGNITITKDTTLYAQWEINQYTATFYSNLITNGQFSDGTNGWTTENAGTIAVDTSVKCGTQNSMRITSSTKYYDGLITAYDIDYKPNTTYKITFKAYRDSTSSHGDLTKRLMVFIKEYNSSGGFISYHHNINISNSNLPDKTWKEFTTTFTTSSLGAYFRPLQFGFGDESGTATVWIADVKLEEVQTKTLNYGSQLGTLPTTTRTGYSSGGYYTGENGTGTQISPTTLLLRNTTYYEKWINN